MPDLDVFRSRRAILLDLDGTLYCTATYSSYVREVDLVTGGRIQALCGAADAAEAFHSLVGLQQSRGWGSKSETLERGFGIGLAEMNRHRERWTKPEDHLRPDPRLVATLGQLRARFLLVLGTNNAPGLARRILACLGVDANLFCQMLTSEDLGAAKPDPRFFRGVAARLSLECRDIVSVGDLPASDIVPAASLGMGTYLVESMEDLYQLAAARP